MKRIERERAEKEEVKADSDTTSSRSSCDSDEVGNHVKVDQVFDPASSASSPSYIKLGKRSMETGSCFELRVAAKTGRFLYGAIPENFSRDGGVVGGVDNKGKMTFQEKEDAGEERRKKKWRKFFSSTSSTSSSRQPPKLNTLCRSLRVEDPGDLSKGLRKLSLCSGKRRRPALSNQEEEDEASLIKKKKMRPMTTAKSEKFPLLFFRSGAEDGEEKKTAAKKFKKANDNQEEEDEEKKKKKGEDEKP